MRNIETVERDDLGDAVWQLAQQDSVKTLGVTEELAQEWFDVARDY
ncbi:hypothetical protein [Diaphorobacter caeni]|nr:hypothetical protein [Diaphorobacter caeni]